MIRWLQAKKY